MNTPRRHRTFSHRVVATRLHHADQRAIAALARSTGKREAVVVRELVHEALRQYRLREAGRDEVTAPVRDAQREIVREETSKLLELLEDNARARDVMWKDVDDVRDAVTLMFEMLFDVWSAGRWSRDALFLHLVEDTLTAEKLRGRSVAEYRRESYAAAARSSATKLATIREQLAADPLSSKRHLVASDS